MKKSANAFSFAIVSILLLALILGCSGAGEQKKAADWPKSRKIAGKEQKLSHISGLVTDDKFAYATIGGTIADRNAGMSGLRKVDLKTGAAETLDNGENMPQAENGGLAQDEKYVYWNGGGKLLRVSKTGGQPETIVAENVGIGVDLVVDGEKIYWANHGYYSPDAPTPPAPVYAVAKQGGKPEIFADAQKIAHALVADEKYVYWVTPTSILKKAKAGGAVETVFQASEKEGVDELSQDATDLYFGFRGAGESRWELRKISKQGGAATVLVKPVSLKPFVIDDANVYFFNEDGLTADLLCRVAKTGGAPVTLDTGYSSGIAVAGKTEIYFAGLDDIYGFTK
ncbi:MAG: hypothetical protein JSS81_20610 [Acidobacteria bacterium]|nr:hypothetical protein [Acidobacteriota bacterium]